MTSTAALRRRALLASATALIMQGCASVGGQGMSALDIRPTNTAPPPMSESDAFYGSAVAAIDQRDYARALDLLQTARARAPGDVRILNAFGVVYDKLGRFDLSQRYYALAQAAEPTSTIVAQNLAYSRTLQGDATAVALSEVGDPLSHTTAAQIERAAPPRTLAQLRREPPSVAIAQSEPAAVAGAPAPPPGPQPVVMVSPAPVITATEPFVVRLTSMFRDTTVAPRALRIALPQPAAAPSPAKLASLPSVPRVEPRLAVVSKPAVARPASIATPVPRSQAAAAARIAAVAVATPSQAPPQVQSKPPLAAVASNATITRAALRTPSGTTAAAPAKHIVTAQSARAKAMLGRPVLVVYSASGRRDAERLRAQLGRRGWTLAVASRRMPPPRMTVVRYDAGGQRVALALMRSLRIPVKLERCRAQCSGVTIILGRRGALRMATWSDHPWALG